MGRARVYAAIVLIAVAVLGGGADVGQSASPSSDWSVSVSGPNQSAYGAVNTYTAVATNLGPDPSGYQWQLAFRFNGVDPAVTLVSSDCDGAAAYYTPPGFGNQIASVGCDSPAAPIGVGATQTMHVSLSWSQQGTTSVGADVIAPNYVPDPNRDNNAASVVVVVTPSGSAPPPPPPPSPPPPPAVSPSYAFAASLPNAIQYAPYAIASVPCDQSVQCPLDVKLISGSLPPGIKLNDDANGGLIGTPTTPGTYTFTLQAIPNVGTNLKILTHDYALVVEPFRQTSTSAPPTLILPNRSRTPGVTNPAVTQSTIKTTICLADWTKKIRPPASYTSALKLKQMKQYGEKGSPSAYEEDLLIPLELGGAPRNPKNLWPEPHNQSKHSDPLERALQRKVCGGTITLAAARKQIVNYKRTRG